MLFRFENRLIFTPAPYREQPYEKISELPYHVEDITIQSTDGVTLHAWYCAHPEAKVSLLYSHGNTGNISDRLDALSFFHHAKVNILLYDYRGYGRSNGKPTEEGVYADARAAAAWLARRVQCSVQDLVLLGRSLGGAIAVELASSQGAAGLILECTFSSITDVAYHRYPAIPVRRILKTRMDSLQKIPRYNGPLLQVHGDTDMTIPLKLAQRLFEKANAPKTFVLVEGGTHHEVYHATYKEALRDFLAGVAQRTVPTSNVVI